MLLLNKINSVYEIAHGGFIPTDLKTPTRLNEMIELDFKMQKSQTYYADKVNSSIKALIRYLSIIRIPPCTLWSMIGYTRRLFTKSNNILLYYQIYRF